MIEEALERSMVRPGVVNAKANVQLETVGVASLKRARIILSVKADYKGITPVARMFTQKKLGGTLIIPIGDWKGKE